MVTRIWKIRTCYPSKHREELLLYNSQPWLGLAGLVSQHIFRYTTLAAIRVLANSNLFSEAPTHVGVSLSSCKNTDFKIKNKYKPTRLM